MKKSSSPAKFVFFISYILICCGLLYVLINEQTPQPIGLVTLAIVLTPVVVMIIGGLPTDSMDIMNTNKSESKAENQASDSN